MKKNKLLLKIIVIIIFIIYAFFGLFYLYLRVRPKLDLKKANTIILYDKNNK